MKFPFLAFAILLSFLACKPASEPKSEDTMEDVPPSPEPERLQQQAVQRYCYVSATDSVMLSLTISGKDDVKGTYMTAYAGKDRNSGRIENGHLEGDLLIADYIFMSEGTESVRQVAFRLGENSAREGFGDVRDENGKQVFKDPNRLNYQSSFSLQKGACPK